MRIVIAPAAFKGTIAARDAAAVMAAAIPEHDCLVLPMADGGDGTLDVLLAHGFTERSVSVVDAIGRPRAARIAVRMDEAVIELAEVCGIAQLDAPAPMTASTRGVGLAIRAALDAGARSITLCLGGSASTDGGTGMLSALGWQFLDASGAVVADGLAGLPDIATVDASNSDPRLRECALTVLVDVDAPLCGPRGAAYAFGPQKGVEDLPAADAALAHLAQLMDTRAAEQPGAGAAGGAGFAALAALEALPVRGADAVAELIGLDGAINGADLVLTGEGRFDATTAAGKAPARVIAAAKEAGVRIGLIAGSVEDGMPSAGVDIVVLEHGSSWDVAIRDATREIVSKVAGAGSESGASGYMDSL